jgi:hypothetical protein
MPARHVDAPNDGTLFRTQDDKDFSLFAFILTGDYLHPVAFFILRSHFSFRSPARR